MNEIMDFIILSLCVPTFNRREQIIKNVQNYLSIDDSRFIVSVCDNCSTDGTWEALCDIKNPKLFLYQNEYNVGGPSNIMRALSSAKAKYLLIILDKDELNAQFLSQFIDVLEDKKPQWGMVNLGGTTNGTTIVYKQGLEAIRVSSVYSPKHPSGFFVRKDIFDEFIDSGWKNVEKRNFVFPFEFSQLYLALHYDMLMVNVPLIITEKKEICQKVKSNTYTESNCWFLYEARKTYYQVFLTRIMKSIDDTKLKRTIIEEMTKVALRNVSVVMRSWLLDNAICMHYYVKSRYVTALEMTKNMHGIIQEYKKYTAHTPAFSFNLYIKLYGLIIKCFVKYSIKDIVKYRKK